LIGLDFETTALTPEEGRVRLVQIANGEDTYIVDCFSASPRPLLELALREDVVAHNANFEELWLWHEFCLQPEKLMHDTMIMSQVLYGGTEDFKKVRHGLADVVQRELGIDLDKELQESDWGAEELTYEQLDYAAKDAEILLPLAGRLIQRLYDEGLMPTYELEKRVRPAVDAMERYGVAVHRDRLEALIEDATQRAEALKAELAEEWGINPGSGKQLLDSISSLTLAGLWAERLSMITTCPASKVGAKTCST
jgi:DNA polymerase-1